MTSLMALIAFVFTKNNEIDIILLYLSFFTMIILGIGIIILQFKIKRLIKKIGEL